MSVGEIESRVIIAIGREVSIRQRLGVLTVLCLLMYSGVFVSPMAAQAAQADDQELAKGRDLLKRKLYTEARTVLEASLKKNSSDARAHFYPAEACRALKAWACAEEHYETSLDLDANSTATGSAKLPLRKAHVWRLLDEAKAWRLLEEAKGMITDVKAHPDKMKQARDSLDTANEMGLNDEQQAVYQQLVVKLPQRQSTASPKMLKPNGLTGGAEQAGNQDVPMALVPAGEFMMESSLADDEMPMHRVYLNAFYMDKHEVTVGQYAKYLEVTEMEEPPDWAIMNQPQHQNRPVVNVDWEDAVMHCKWAGKRLPTEAEWEKAARGTDGRIYPWGNEAPTRLHANYGRKEWNNHLALVPVGSFEEDKSPYGIYDMAGMPGNGSVTGMIMTFTRTVRGGTQ